jgi:tRNA (guanine37-N1)-methyltransferase
MRFDLITLFPDHLQQCARVGVIGRAIERGQLALQCWNPRDYTDDPYRRIDERPFGGGPGMVMLVEPLRRTLAAIQTDAPERGRVIHFSPRGELLTQAKVRQLAALPRLILIASRYEGVDQRFLDDHVDEEISIGDYVLAGGELPALTLLEAIGRLQPGVLHSDDSAQQDSFGESGLLDCPHYTRPEHLPEGDVPPVLLSGDHAAIARWRREQQLLQTAQRRPDLLGRIELSKTDRALLKTHGYVV